MHFQMLRNFIIDLGAHIWIIFVKIWLANTESFYKRFVHGLWIGFGRLRGEEVSALFAPLGSISSTNLHTAFTPVAPQSIRTQSSCQYLFTLLGSSSVKAVHRTLMKLSPGVNSSTFYEHLFCQWISTDMNGAWRRAGMSNWRPHCLFNAARNDLFNSL